MQLLLFTWHWQNQEITCTKSRKNKSPSPPENSDEMASRSFQLDVDTKIQNEIQFLALQISNTVI